MAKSTGSFLLPLLVLGGAAAVLLTRKAVANAPPGTTPPGAPPSLPPSSPPVVVPPITQPPTSAPGTLPPLGPPNLAALFESTRVLKNTTPMQRGDDVLAWQAVLNSSGLSIDADGIYGPATAAATQAWQGRYGISADGMVGPETRARAHAVLFGEG
jgi:peptidoglycan hydrolase-like protein with peptidoglycan-binding domain